MAADPPPAAPRAERSRPSSHGLSIIGVALVLAALQCALTLDTATSAADLRALLRVTAQTSLVWFLLAFAARPLVSLHPAPWTKWLLRHRRHLGLAMAISHAVHLAAIVALAADLGAPFWRSIAITTLIGGGLGYLLIFAMVATSTDRTAAWLGRRRWRALHLTGMWTLWVIFFFTYAGQLGRASAALVAVVPLLAAAGLRVAVHRRRR
jgi:hypothetical protein